MRFRFPFRFNPYKPSHQIAVLCTELVLFAIILAAMVWCLQLGPVEDAVAQRLDPRSCRIGRRLGRTRGSDAKSGRETRRNRRDRSLH